MNKISSWKELRRLKSVSTAGQTLINEGLQREIPNKNETGDDKQKFNPQIVLLQKRPLEQLQGRSLWTVVLDEETYIGSAWGRQNCLPSTNIIFQIFSWLNILDKHKMSKCAHCIDPLHSRRFRLDRIRKGKFNTRHLIVFRFVNYNLCCLIFVLN